LRLLAVETQNQITAEQSRFVRRSAWYANAVQHDTLFRVLELIDSNVRLNDRSPRDGPYTLSSRRHQRGERRCSNEKDSNPTKSHDKPLILRRFLAGNAPDVVATSEVPVYAPIASARRNPQLRQKRSSDGIVERQFEQMV
jgi:hypothetical protein